MRSTSTSAARAQALPHRGVLRVDRDDLAAARRACLGHDRAGGDQALLVGQREPLAGVERGEGRRQARESDHGVEHDVDVGERSQFGQHVRFPGARAHRVGGNVELGRLPGQQLGVGTGRESDDAVLVAVLRKHVERLSTDRSRRSEDGDAALHDHEVRGRSERRRSGPRPARSRCAEIQTSFSEIAT